MIDNNDDLAVEVSTYSDEIAERAHAYAVLLGTLTGVEPKLRAEGLLMLAAIRETVRSGPKGELRKIK